MRRVSDPAATPAWRCRGSCAVMETELLQASDASGSQCELTNEPYWSTLLAVGEVRMVEAEMNPDVISRRVHAGWVEHGGHHIETTVFSR